MVIKEPKVELIWQNDIKEHVCKCARVCYGKESGDDERLYNSLLKAGHYSMFRHASYYAIVKDFTRYATDTLLQPFENCPYLDWHHNSMSQILYIVANGNFMLDYKDSNICEMILRNMVSPDEFMNASVYSKNLMRFTFKITTQNCTAKELNRVSPNNIAEISTRRVLMDSICAPHWLSQKAINAWNNMKITNAYGITFDDKEWEYLTQCESAFNSYERLLDFSTPMPKEDARGILPLDTATTVVYTYSYSEWKHIIGLRTDKKGHKNCQIIVNMIKKELEGLGYEF